MAVAVHPPLALRHRQPQRYDVPWRAICILLESVGSEGTAEDFFRRTLEGLETLVSYDFGVAVVSDVAMNDRPLFVIKRPAAPEGQDEPRRSIRISSEREPGAYGFILSLHRRGDRSFSAHEQRVLDALSPHLRNFLRVLMEPRVSRERVLLDAGSRAGLSAREKQIYVLLCERFTVTEMAQRLTISSHTVAKHIEHIYDKLLVSGRRGACAF